MDIGADEIEATPAVRRTRGALHDLSRQLAGVTVTLLSTPNTNNQLPSSMMTPSQSPDEMIIQLRGRKNPVTWSPLSINGVQKLAQYEITPPKGKICHSWTPQFIFNKYSRNLQFLTFHHPLLYNLI